MTVNNLEIPPNATIRQEYVRSGNPDCQNSHGPYLYAYWKQDKKLNKKYVGKNFEDFAIRKIASCSHTFFPTNSRDYFNQFGRLIPYDFINQVIPIVFKVTGQETLDVVTLPTGGKDAVKNISTNIVASIIILH